MRIGLFGGTFAPVTLGHLEGALLALKQHRLDKVLFLPVGRHRLKQAVMDRAHRIAMLEGAIAPYPQLGICTLEVDSPEESRTYETLRRFRQQHPGDEVFFIMGADVLPQLSQGWYKPEELLRENAFILLTRPGYDVEQAVDADPLLRRYKDSLLKRVTPVAIAVSSSMVRRQARLGLPLKDLVPEAVERYILEKGLFVGGEEGNP